MTGKTPALLVLLVCLAGTEFVLRGPVRWLSRDDYRHTDLVGPYLATRAWVRGLNPYTSDVFWTLAGEVDPAWAEGHSVSADDFESRTAYPITALVLLAPVAVLSWPVARVVGILVMAALMVAAIAALSSVSSLRTWDNRRYLFLALALALAPVHTTLSVGNLVAAAVALSLLAVWAALNNRWRLAGVLIACAACLKPPIAAPALAYFVVRSRWATVGTAAAVTTGIFLVGAGRLALSGTPWLADYVFNNSMLLADHGSAVIEWTATQTQFINLHYLGLALSNNARAVNAIALGLSGALVVAWLLLLSRRGRQESGLLELSTLFVISLLPIYHRVYDAAILLLPLCWVLADTRPRMVWPRRVTMLLLVPFFVPGSTLLELLAASDRVPAALASHWWWRALVIPHQVWALLLMAMTLLVAQAAGRHEVPLRAGR